MNDPSCVPIEQPFAPGFLLPPHVHENDVWLYILAGEMHARVGDEIVKATLLTRDGAVVHSSFQPKTAA